MKDDTKSSYKEIEKILESIRRVPPREEDSVQRGRAAYLKSIDNLPEPVSPPLFLRLNLRNLFIQLRFRTLTIAIILAAFISGGAITAGAARSASPGEQLYPLKIWLEEIRMDLTLDPAKQLQLHLKYAAERMAELKELDSQGDDGSLEEIIYDFNQHIQEAGLLMEGGRGDEQEKAELNDLISEFGEFGEDENEQEDLDEPAEQSEEIEPQSEDEPQDSEDQEQNSDQTIYSTPTVETEDQDNDSEPVETQGSSQAPANDNDEEDEQSSNEPEEDQSNNDEPEDEPENND